MCQHNDNLLQHLPTPGNELEKIKLASLHSEFTHDNLLDVLLEALNWGGLLQQLGIELAGGVATKSECLDIGKASEEARQHPDLIVVKEFELNSQHLNTRDHSSSDVATHPDVGVADAQLVHYRHQESQYAQVGCMTNLDSRAHVDDAADVVDDTAGSTSFPEHEPLEARGVLHGDLFHDGHAHLDAPQAVAGDTEAQELAVADDLEILQDGASVEQEGELPLTHDKGAEAELPEVGEGGSARDGGDGREPQEADVEAGEGAAPEERGREGHIGVELGGAVDEDEFLDAPGSEELEPERELAPVRVHGGARDVDAAEGARVRGEGARHHARDVAHAVHGAEQEAASAVQLVGPGSAPGVLEVGVGEDERRRAPEAAPARGERGGARGVPGGEAGEDVAEDVDGEGADAIDAVARGPRRGGEGEGRVEGDGRVGERGVDVLGDHPHVVVQPQHLQRVGLHRLHGGFCGGGDVPDRQRRGFWWVEERRRLWLWETE
ncbi:Os06g0493001, partial [Oryza sativa Japonica Group]